MPSSAGGTEADQEEGARDIEFHDVAMKADDSIVASTPIAGSDAAPSPTRWRSISGVSAASWALGAGPCRARIWRGANSGSCWRKYCRRCRQLGDNNLYPGLLEHLGIGWLEAAVGHHDIDILKVADGVSCWSVEFAAVHEGDGLVGAR